MGACASTPKTLGDDAGKEPVPEQPKEETTTTEAVVVADEAVEEVKADQEAEPKEEVKTAVDGVEEQDKSLGSLLETTEEVKKETAEEEAVAPVVEEKEEVAAPSVEEEAAEVEPKKE